MKMTHTSFRVRLVRLWSGNFLRLNSWHGSLWFPGILFVTFVEFYCSVRERWNSHRISVVASNIQNSLLKYPVGFWGGKMIWVKKMVRWMETYRFHLLKHLIKLYGVKWYVSNSTIYWSLIKKILIKLILFTGLPRSHSPAWPISMWQDFRLFMNTC